MKALSRKFTIDGQPAREVVLTISVPKRWRKDWACRVRLEGVPDAEDLVPGADPVQAILLALESARLMLDATGLPLRWLDNAEPGDVGIPKFVPTTYGFEMQRRWERYLEREATRSDHAVNAFIKERTRRRDAEKRWREERARRRAEGSGSKE